jgi:hypothetical protein
LTLSLPLQIRPTNSSACLSPAVCCYIQLSERDTLSIETQKES